MFDYLSCGFLYAVCCEIDGDRIRVGLLIAEGDPEPQEVNLYAEDGESFKVFFENSGTNLELRRL